MKYSQIMMWVLCASMSVATVHASTPADYVDPRIGSEGLGRVFIGPSHPYGMVKPSPDCTTTSNSGWLPMPERIDGFSQIHVSGTGGGPKYGNILIMPFNTTVGMSSTTHYDTRLNETIELGYYATRLSDSDINVEITTAPRASVYRITYPECSSVRGLAIDAGFFLGEQPEPDAREAQQFVGSEVEIDGDNAVRGYTRIRGGWNDGRAYTVYFYATTSSKFINTSTWRDNEIGPEPFRADMGNKTGVLLQFPHDTDTLIVNIGISFVSELKARYNCLNQVTGKSFDQVRASLRQEWDRLLSRVTIDASTPDSLKRMFYTALYHTMLMPSDRTGECPLWNDPTPYYDDYYAIWDTYRTSMPLITIIDPCRQRDIVNSLLTIYKRDGYMPDARSGNANGRTQGGSNADVVIADAMVKGLEGIDYNLALEAMTKDAEVPPGGKEEAEGRGGLLLYNSLGYIPHGVPRAGNRTVEYSLCDYAIAVVAGRLGLNDISNKYMARSHNWRNLWRADYLHDGTTGFIMPRDMDGAWLDSIPYGNGPEPKPHYRYTPVTFEGPWYTPWWSMFFYEASSWEYSLSIPHDVDGLIEACGGHDAMLQRLTTFFDHGYFNVNNEPSFLTPCLYHWLGMPHMTSYRVADIIHKNYSAAPDGLPGNDDSGAMSSWLAFHIMGIYPNAGHDYYIIHSPLVKSATITPTADTEFTIKAVGFDPKNRPYIIDARLNGKSYPYSTLSHDTLIQGGTLELFMGSQPSSWGKEMFAK